MNIRKIQETDLNALNDLYTELSGQSGDVQLMKQLFTSINENRDYYLLGAEVDGKIVGTLMGIVCHDLVGGYKAFMTIENVIVAEIYRGRGIARALFEDIEMAAKERSCSYIYLVSGNSRKAAHQMYRNRGYRCDNVLGFKKFLSH